MKNAISDTYQIVIRNLKRNFRLPQLIIFSSVQPIIFLLLFNFVFGGAVSAGADTGEKYINFLLPGILAQIALFGAIQTGVGLAEDLNRGVIDRLRSLPIARSAVLTGRTLADAARNVLVITLLIIVGFFLGFRFDQGILNLFFAILLVIGFAFAFSWFSANIGMLVKDSETVQVAGFLWVFPLVFASAVFVPIQTMPGWLQAFARNQPVTQVVDAVRYLLHGGVGAEHIWHAIFWIIAIIVVFAPLAVYNYRRAQ